MNATPIPPLNTLTPCLDPRHALQQALAIPARTRVAPSPTGFFHLGTARCAIHNKLAALASGGSFFLRIDDTDAARNDQAHVDLIQQSLTRLQIGWDALYFQSARRSAHQAAAHLLLRSGAALMDQGALLLAPDWADQLPNHFMDLASGLCTISSTTRDQAKKIILLRSDGAPTYHLASVVDDIDLGINLILRGADHLSNAPKHIALAQALAAAGWPGASDFCAQVRWAHVALITKDGKKLSKRDLGSNLSSTLDDHLPQAVFHWALMLGWGHPDPRFDQNYPILDQDQACVVFAQGRLRSAPCDLNHSRLAAFNRAYTRAAHSLGQRNP